MYCYSAHDRQDLFQEIVAQLWKAFPKFRNEARISTWMYRIALNTAISDFRKQQRRISIAGELPHSSTDIPEYSYREQQERLAMLQQAVNYLSDIEKAIVILYLEEKNYQEMEEVLGISQPTLRVKMNRIKEKLRRHIGQAE